MKRDENGVVLPVKTSYPAAATASVNMKNKEEEQDCQAKPKKKFRENKLPIGEDEITEAKNTLGDYMASKKAYDIRYSRNFDEYNLLYTENAEEQFIQDDDGVRRKVLIPRRKGAQCLNVIMNKHADAMDNYPELICLPRAADDEKTAAVLNSVIPCIHKRNGFLKVYSDVMLDKFVGGCGAYSVTWDSCKDNGLGDIAISRADILSLFWQDHIENIQDSDNVFYLREYSVEGIKKLYPGLESESAETLGLEEYRTYDNKTKASDKAALVDWYYKKDGNLHLCKFCGNKVIFSSENEMVSGNRLYENGYYEHGQYPFILEPMFRLRDTPVGFGFVDICRAPQNYLDDLKVDILTNVKVNSQPRVLANDSAGVNFDDLADLTKTVVKTNGDPRSCTLPIVSKDLAAGALSVYNKLIEEIKETTATNDASNGASAAGVTSGSAIVALQEAGGKVSRDSNKLSQESATEIGIQEIGLMRQFYTLPRFFRITGIDRKADFIEFDNSGLRKQNLSYTDEFGNSENYVDGDGNIMQRLPVFDIDVRAQRSSPFVTAAQNELMLTLFKVGAFRPEAADASLIMLDCMSFEGKDKIVQKIKENKTLLQTVKELANKLTMMEAMNAQKNAVNMQAEHGAVSNMTNIKGSPNISGRSNIPDFKNMAENEA